MSIMRSERPASGGVGSTWPSAVRSATRVARLDRVDEAGEESFPCSDPPPWTTGPSPAAPAEERETPTPREASSPLHEVEVATVDEIPAGEVRGVEVEGREIALCRLEDGVYALSGACSYHPIPLRGATLEGEVLTCPWYGAQFDVRTGESVFLRSARPLTTYATAVRSGRVFVRLPADPVRVTPSRWVGVER